MSKVQTLIKVITYQKEHPLATGREISEAIGITEQYLRKCRKDIKELSSYFLGTLLEKNEMDLLLSKLDPQNGHENIILRKLQKVHLDDKDGKIEIASSEDKTTMEYLHIALCQPKGDRTLMDFWLGYLLYDTLLLVDREGEIEYKLASSCEPVEGYSKWHVKLRDDVHWSDGKPITCDDVENTLIKNNLLFSISEIKKDGKKGVIFILNQSNPIFPSWLSSIPILPSHSADATSGPFRMRKGKSATSFQIYRNKDYHMPYQPKLDWIKFRIFSRQQSAIDAVLRKEFDLFPARSLREISQWTSVPPQSFPFDGLNYYALLINPNGQFKSKDSFQELKRAIDYGAINLCISGVLPQEHKATSHKIMENIKISYAIDSSDIEGTKLFNFMTQCLWGQNIDLIDLSRCSPEDANREIDAILTQIYFGYGYSRLRRYFHSEREDRTLGFSYPEIDSLIDQLDRTESMNERDTIGQEVVRKLQQENAIILLAPCFEYLLSNLYLVPSPKLHFLTDFIKNLPKMKVQRGKFSL